jgi:hypothetical protein
MPKNVVADALLRAFGRVEGLFWRTCTSERQKENRTKKQTTTTQNFPRAYTLFLCLLYWVVVFLKLAIVVSFVPLFEKEWSSRCPLPVVFNASIRMSTFYPVWLLNTSSLNLIALYDRL